MLGIVVATVNHDWFGDLVNTRHNLFRFGMGALLLNIYFAAKKGEPLSKKRAARLSRMDDMKTGAKYIQFAVEEGLVLEQRGTVDKRVIYLLPTDKLECRIRDELQRFAAALQAR